MRGEIMKTHVTKKSHPNMTGKERKEYREYLQKKHKSDMKEIKDLGKKIDALNKKMAKEEKEFKKKYGDL
jgi:hypothetical protein